MECEAGRCNKTSTPSGIFIMILSLEGMPTKAKEAPSKTDPAGHQPSISMCWVRLEFSIISV